MLHLDCMTQGRKQLKHGTGGTVMEWISVNTDIDWFAEYDYCGCKWECLPEPPKEDAGKLAERRKDGE